MFDGRGWPRLQRHLGFVALRAAVRHAGFERLERWGRLAGDVHFFWQRGRRRQLLRDLAQVLERRPDDLAVVESLRSAYRINSVAVLEVLSMLDQKLSLETLRERCRLEGLERLSAARAGNGAILLLTHAGNTLLLAARLAAEGWPITSIYRKSKLVPQDFFSRGLQQYGIQDVKANEGVAAYASMLRALRDGRIVCVTIDQGVNRRKEGILMRFLGKEMPMPAGPAYLAKATGASILPVATLSASPHWHFRIEAPVQPDRETGVADLTRTLLDINERQILARPELWSWHHRRWRKFPIAS